jgi:hypothetical protein
MMQPPITTHKGPIINSQGQRWVYQGAASDARGSAWGMVDMMLLLISAR